jgi:hypothetical protein
MLATKLKSAACKNPLRDPADADKRLPHNRMAGGITDLRDRRRRFGQRPTRRFVTARDAAQEHPVALKLQQVVMTVHATKYLPYLRYHSRAKAIVLPSRVGLGSRL